VTPVAEPTLRPDRAKVHTLPQERWPELGPGPETLRAQASLEEAREELSAYQAQLDQLRADGADPSVIEDVQSEVQAWRRRVQDAEGDLAGAREGDAEEAMPRRAEALAAKPLAWWEQAIGSELMLGDLVITNLHDAYRGLDTWIVIERDGALAVVEPFRGEYYVTPPSSLSYPSLLPSLRYFDDYRVECVPLDHAWLREQLADAAGAGEIEIDGVELSYDEALLASLREHEPGSGHKHPGLNESWRVYAYPARGELHTLEGWAIH